MNTLTRAVDFQTISMELRQGLHSIGHNPDLLKMYKNIEQMVTNLSKREVDARRIHNFSILDKEIEEINRAIKHLDKLIFMARLMT